MTTPSRLRGFVIQDRRISASTVLPNTGEPGTVNQLDAYYTQAGRLPGIAVPSSDSEMVLETGGVMPDYDLDYQIQRGGYPGPDGATGIWKKQSDGSTSYRGWTPPKTIVGSEIAISTSGHVWKHPDAVALPTGEIVAVCYHTGGGDVSISAVVRDTSGAWTRYTVAEPTVTTYDPQATICMREFADPTLTPELYCFWLCDARNDGVNQYYQIGASRSIDGGATWTQIAAGVLDAPLNGGAGYHDFDLGRLRSAFIGDQILLLIEANYGLAAETYESILLQYASSDFGHNFTLVSEWDGSTTQAGRYFEIVKVNDTAMVFYLDPEVDAAGPAPAYRTISNAYEDLAQVAPTFVPWDESASTWSDALAATSGAGADQQIDDGDLAVAMLPSGGIWLYVRAVSGSYDGWCTVSYDFGETWRRTGQDDSVDGGKGKWFYQNDANSHPTEFKAIAQGGRIVILANADSNPGGMDSQLFVFAMGGWTTLPLQLAETTSPDKEKWRTSWFYTWVPIDEPDSSSPDTASGPGTSAVSAGTGYLSISTTAVNTTRLYTYAATHNATGMMGEWVVQRDSGGSNTSPVIGGRLTTDDGTNRYQISICIDGTSVSVRDEVAGSEIDNETMTTTEPFVLRAALVIGSGGSNNGDCKVWVAPLGTATKIPEDLNSWTLIASADGLNRAASVASGDTYEWGHVAAAAANTSSRWWFRGYQERVAETTFPAVDGYTNPDNLPGGPIGFRGWTAGGLLLTGRGGPAISGQAWTVTRRYTYGLSNLLADQPVSRSWRSTADNTAMFFGWEFADGLSDDAYLESDSIGVLMLGHNLQSWIIEGWSFGGSAWTTLATVGADDDLADGATWPFLREGGTVRPSSSANPANRRYIHRGEFRNATISLAGTLRRVTGNTDGAWVGSSIQATKMPTLFVPGAANGDPTSGDATVYSRNTLTIIHTGGTAYRALRIRLTAQQTVDNYYEIHKCIVGGFTPIGKVWSADGSVEVRPQVTRTERRDGTVSQARQGRTVRAFRVRWADPVDVRQIYTETAPVGRENSTVQNRTLATPGASASVMTGLLDEDAFNRQLVVYVRRCDTGSVSGDVFVTSDPEAFACVRVLSGQEWNGVLGDEAESQLVTGGDVELLEEVEP